MKSNELFARMKWKYGFVTFERATDAYDAIDTGSNNPALKEYDISFGGRRAFCREKYLDLGNLDAKLIRFVSIGQ